MEQLYKENYSVRRNDSCANFVCHLSLLLHYYKNIHYENLNLLYPLADQSFVLLPKHQHWLDIPLEGLLLKGAINRYGNYIMKNSLPRIIFEPLGGISIIRGKDLKKIIRAKLIDYEREGFNRKDAQKKAILSARKAGQERMQRIYQYEIPSLLEQDEIIVTHIEGERKEINAPVELHSYHVKNILSSQKAWGKQITFVPLDITYSGKDVTLAVGHPVRVSDGHLDDLVEHLKKEVSLWRA